MSISGDHLAELQIVEAMLRRWYEAASPYATPEALKAALAQRPEEQKIAAFDAECWRHAVANNIISAAGVAIITSEVRRDMNVSRQSEEK